MNSGITFKNGLCALLVLFSGLVMAQIDVIVEITPGTVGTFTPGTSQGSSYSFTVKKTPTAAAGTISGLSVTASFDIIAKLTGLAWTCTVVPTGASDCLTAGGTGAINTLIDLADTDGVVFTFTNVQILSDVFTDMDFLVATNNTGTNNDDMDSKTITRASQTDINVNVNDSSTTYTPGVSGVDYTIQVLNAGPSDALNVDFSHVVPPGMTVTGYTCTPQTVSSSCSPPAPLNDLSLDVASGETTIIVATADYDSGIRTINLVYAVSANILDTNATDPSGPTPAIATDSDALNLVSNLSIVVDTTISGDTNYTPGNGQTYTVTVSNSGDSDVLAATVIDNNLSEFSAISWTCSFSVGSSCTAGTVNSRLNTTADIVAGGSVTYTVTVSYDSATTTDPLIYTVTATNPTGTPVVTGTSPVNDSKSLIYDPESNLSLTLDDSKTTYTPGENGLFTLVVGNTGPSDVTGVSVIDNVIAEFETAGVSWTCLLDDNITSCGTASNVNNVNTLVNIPASDNATFTITGAFDSSAVTNPLVYTATANNPMGVRGTTNVSGTDSDDVLDRKVNLSITKTSKNGSLVPNEPFTYSIVVSNAGPSDLGAGFMIDTNGVFVQTENGVNLVDNLDVNLLGDHPTNCNVNLQPEDPVLTTPCWEYCSSDRGAIDGDITPDNCPLTSEIVKGTGEVLSVPLRVASGNSSEIRIHTRLKSAGGSDCDIATAADNEVCNTVTISIAEPLTTQNVGADALTDDVSNEITNGTDLVVTKTDGKITTASGTSNSYDIVVRNNGFVPAIGITVTDVMPLYPTNLGGYETNSISWTCTTSDAGACCNTLSNICGLGSPTSPENSDQLNASIDLEAQTEVTFTITGDIAANATGIISNSVTATLPADVDETNPLNNTNIVDTTSLGEVSDIKLEKTLGPITQNTNDPTITNLTYKIVVTNLGPSSASNINVVDQLSDLKFDLSTRSWTCAITGQGSCVSAGPVTNAAINTQVSLEVNSTATFMVEVSTQANKTGKVVNVASATTAGFDPVDSNNSDSVEYSLSGTSKLTISNSGSPSVATPGKPVSYTINVTNEGPDDAFGANVVDVFPPELSDVEWSCSAVSPVPGGLTAFQTSLLSASGTHMIASPDDNHIYVTSPNINGIDSKLYVFKRNTVVGSQFGDINIVETITQGVDSVDGIETPLAMSMSNSGQHLYVLSDVVTGMAPTIATFGRDTNPFSANFGKLTYLGPMADNIPAAPVDILLSNNQKYVYITGDDEINVYSRDTGSGLLAHVSTILQSDAGAMAQNPDGSIVYVVDATGGNVNAYTSNSMTGDLTFINTLNDANIGSVNDVVSSDDGMNLYLASTGTNKLVVLDQISGGGPIAVAYNTAYNDINLLFNATETLVGLTSVAISKDGQHVFVGNPIADAVFVLNRTSQGALNKQEKINVVGLDEVNDVIITIDGKHVMTTASGLQGKTLTVLERRQPDPVFAFVESEIDGYNDTIDTGGVVDGLLGASAVVVSYDGKYVYAAGLGDNSISVFARDKSKGSTNETKGLHLNFIASYNNNDSGISNIIDVDSMVITPNDKYLYVGSADQSTLAVFKTASDGTLTQVESHSHASNTIDGLLGVAALAVDATSQDLYIAGKFEASVAHYSINSADGKLTFVDAVANGDAGVNGLAGARSIAISPDGQHVIVANSIDDSVVVLSRDAMDGKITFMQSLFSVGDQPMDLAISPDGEHVYVVSANDSRLTVLKRVTGSDNFGRLSNITSYSDGIAGFDYLLGARTVAVSNDGSKVYVGSEFDNAISMMDREQNSNSVTFGQLALIEVQVAIQVETDNANQVEVLSQIYDLVVSKDSKHVYTAGFSANAISAFVLGSGSSCSAKGSGNIDDIVDVGVNGTLTYSVTAKIRPDATGVLTTEASLISPDNFTTIMPVNNCTSAAGMANENCDLDNITLVPKTDLTITKTDNRLSAIAGEPIQYEIVVSNIGPSNAKSTASEVITITDLLGSDFDSGSVNWTCDATGSGSLAFTQVVKNGNNNTVGLQGVSSLAIASDLAGLGPHVLATSVLDNGLLAFSINQTTGELTQVLEAGDFVQATGNINLTGARDVIVIDNDVYVASKVDDSLVAFKASDSSGLTLSWVANHNFSSGAFGLNQAVSLVASNDGKNIYVAGANDNSVVVFSRDLMTGVLTPTSVITQGDANGSLGLSGVNALAISGDNNSIYTSGVNNGKLGVYKRNLVDGSLSLVEVQDSSSTGVTLTGVSSIHVSNDGKQVYVSSASNNAVYVFTRKNDVPLSDSTYGSLSLQQALYQNTDNVIGLLSPAEVTASVDGRHVYVASEQSDSVVWFARNLDTGNLTFGGIINDITSNVDGLDGAISVVVDVSGNFVYVAGSKDNGIAVLSRLDDSFCLAGGTGDIQTNVDIAVNGSLTFLVNATVAAGVTGSISNTASVSSCYTPVPMDLSTCSGSDNVNTNNTDTDTDSVNPVADLMITKTDGLSQYDGLSGAVKVTGNNENLYVAAKGENAIGIFARNDNGADADFGNLNYLGNVQNGIDGVSGLLAVSDVLLSADGKTLYAAGSGDNSVVVFSRSLADGSLTFLERHSSGVFGVIGIEGVKSIALSDDGMHLYATGPLTNSMAVFTVDQTDGRLSFEQSLQNAVDGASGLISASDVAVSVDGKHVYVTSDIDNSVNVFLRNPNSSSLGFGQLSYMASYTNGVDGVAGLSGASALTLSKANDGDFVYVLGSAEQSVVVFSRDVSTGVLTFVEFKQNGTSSVEGLTLGRDLMLNADETSLYVAGFTENALVQFDRNTTDGTLLFVNALNDGDPLLLPGENIDGLSGASGVFLPSDDTHVYIAASGDNSIAAFGRDNSGTIGQNGNIVFQQSLIDGEGGVSPGTEVTYTIVVSNAGPSNVKKAEIVDVFPPEFEQITYECFPVAGAMCPMGLHTGNVNIVADLPVGSSVEIIAKGMIKSDVTGVLVNTATVASSTNPSDAISDPDLTNNSATDDDTLLSPAVNLVVTKENGVNAVIPGTSVTYTIVVSNDAMMPGNNEPADINNVLITDIVPEEISNVTWSCQAFPQPGLLDDADGNDLINNFTSYNDLDFHNDMVINQSGTHAYVTGVSSGSSVVLVYERNLRTGELLEIQRLTNATNGVSGLAGANGVALSPDQKYLYVASDVDDSVVTFSIDGMTNQLSFVGILTDGLSGVNGLGGATDIVLSIDGIHVYVAAKLDNAIAQFNRNPITGVLSFNTVLTGVEGLSGVEAMVFDATGQFLLVAGESNDSLASFKRTAGSGILVPADVIQDFEVAGSVLKQPRDVIIQAGKVYVASYASDAVSVFDMNALTGELSYNYVIHHGDTSVSALEGPESLVFSDTGNELYVASSISGSVTLFALENEVLSALNVVYDTSTIAGLDNVSEILIDPQGGFFYALSDDLVLASLLNGSNCQSQGTGNVNDMADISSGGHLTYTVQGDVQPAVTGVLSNTATALTGTGFVELFSPDNSATDTDPLTPISDLSVIKTDGLTEVVAGTPLAYDISAFAAGPSTVNASLVDMVPLFPTDNAGFFEGTIQWQCALNKTVQFSQEYSDDMANGLNGVSDVIVSSDGLYAYATSSIDGSVSIFNRNISGELTFDSVVNEGDMLIGGMVEGLAGAASLSFDSTEQYLYIVSEMANSVVVFSRDTNTGLLDFIQKVSSGVDGIVGMTGPVGLVVTPDNKAVYVAAKGSDSITVLARDESTGMLSFVERIKDGFGTIPVVDVIAGINDIKISYDGKFVYTSSTKFFSAIAVFSRDLTTQSLTFVEVIRSGDSNGGLTVAGMDGLQSITMSPGSRYFYAVASTDSSLLTFSRNDIDGTLTYQRVLQVGDADSGEIMTPTSVTITPDGGRLLITDANTDSVSLFDRNISTGTLALVDVFTNIVHGSALMNEPKSLVTDGINILVVSEVSSALVALRITAHSECLVDNTDPNIAAANLFMTPGSAGGINVQALVHPSARGIINNTAAITPILGAGDDNLANNFGLDTTTITIETDVEIIKTGPANAIAGEAIEYTLILTNTGPSDALDVRVTDIFDAAIINATWLCSSTGRSLCNNVNGTGSVDTIVNVAINGQVEINISATVDPAFLGTLDNSATAIVIEEGFNTDTDLSNNTIMISTTVTMVADVAVTKTNNQTVLIAGETIVYEIVVTNNGPSDAPDNLVTDIMPSLLTNVTWTCMTDAASNCSATGTGNINDITYISANGQLTYQVTAFLPSATEVGVISNSVDVEVRQPATDPNLSNNNAVDTDTTDIVADVMIELTSDINPYDPDGPVNLPFLIDITNVGPSDARNVMATFDIAANATYQIPFRCVEQTSLVLLCDIGYMVAGENKKIAIDYRLVEATPTTITSTAIVTATTFDPDLNNNTSMLDTELLTGIDIRVTKSNGSNILRLGFQTTYFIRIDNIGSIDAGNINIVETMPAELLNGTWTCSASNGATCLISNASSVISATGNLPSGGVIEIVVEALVDPALPNLVLTEISNTVEATMVTPIVEQDYQLLNNTATDTDVLLRIIFIDGFEGSVP